MTLSQAILATGLVNVIVYFDFTKMTKMVTVPLLFERNVKNMRRKSIPMTKSIMIKLFQWSLSSKKFTNGTNEKCIYEWKVNEAKSIRIANNIECKTNVFKCLFNKTKCKVHSTK